MEANQYRELTPEELELRAPNYEEDAPQPVRIGPKGYIYTKEYCTKYASDVINMILKEGDIFVSGYQRSGTTWTQELVWLVVNNFDYDKAASVLLRHRYPFLERAGLFTDDMKKHKRELFGNSNKKIIDLLEEMTTPATKLIAVAPSPRFVKTHLPMSMLPPKLLDTAKVVYVARDPRDVIVSSYHHSKMLKMLRFKGTFRQMWNAFRNDLFILTPYFEHVKEAWELKNHPNMLFLFYEELVKDLPAAIRRVSEFFSKEVSPEQMERLCDHLSFHNFKNNKSVNYEEIREVGLMTSNESFMRKGKVGGWRDYFDEEMTRDVEQWIADNLRDTDLVFPSMINK